MTEAVPPILPASDRRAGRRSTDPAIEAAVDEAPLVRANLPVPAAKPVSSEPLAAAFEAQLLGQEGQKRGLRGGPPVLNHAKSAYLGAEWSGKADRRPPKGLFSKTEV